MNQFQISRIIYWLLQLIYFKQLYLNKIQFLSFSHFYSHNHFQMLYNEVITTD